jgi:hypothetical protein
VPFVLAHEYSHLFRGFGEHRPDTMREYLVMEGMAMVLAEATFPLRMTASPWWEPSREEKGAFWASFDPEARGLVPSSDMSETIGPIESQLRSCVTISTDTTSALSQPTNARTMSSTGRAATHSFGNAVFQGAVDDVAEAAFEDA